MDIQKLYKDYGIPFVVEGHKHSREGWVNTSCPFCVGNPGYHLGFHIEEEYFVCWRCGGHSKWKTFSVLLKIPINQVNSILSNYNSISIIPKTKDITPVFKTLKLPTNLINEIPAGHKKYLIGRQFEPKKIYTEWNLKSSKMNSFVDELNFSWRIFVPIYWENKMVSYLGRSINSNNELRYLVCPEKYELQNIKTTIYGKPEKWTDMTILVEGVTDVWKIGHKAVAVYGIKYTPHQVNILAKTFKRIFVVFDDDKQAQVQAKKITAELNFRGVDTYHLKIENDPGSMSPSQIQEFIKDVQTFKIR